MKKMFTLAFALVSIAGQTIAQGFMPLGAQWSYRSLTYQGGGFAYEELLSYKVLTDSLNAGYRYLTVLETKYGQNLSGSGPNGNLQPISGDTLTAYHSLKVNSDTAYIFNPIFQKYTPLYVFSAQAGDTLRIPITGVGNSGFPYALADAQGDSVNTLVVDSVVNVLYAGQPVKTYFVTNVADTMNYQQSTSYQLTRPNMNWAYEVEQMQPKAKYRAAYTNRFGGVGQGLLPSHLPLLYFPDLVAKMNKIYCYQDATLNYVADTLPCLRFQIAPVGINAKTLPASIKIYPNPAGNRLTISSEKGFSASTAISIVDVQGRQALALQNLRFSTRQELDLSKLSAGVYFLLIEAEGQRHYAKFVKE